MSVVWTATAADQLVAARDYVARSSPGYAQAFVERVVSQAELLAGQPQMGAEVPEYGRADLREIFVHPYRVIYRLEGSDVQIVALIHSSRRMPRIPPG